MKSLILIISLILSLNLYSQPWLQQGNTITGPPFDTFFGTLNGYAVRTITEGTIRGFMNPNRTSTINGFLGVNTSGFLGIGPDNLVMSTNDPHLWESIGSFYRLHINSDINPTGVQELGYRPWMRNGIGLTGNSDNFYLCQRSGGADITDNVIGWSDNGPGSWGPDNLLFTFTSGTAATLGATNGDLSGEANNGREIMRLTTNGNIGMGPRFSNANQPQRQLHINTENAAPSWLQISNQNTLGATYGPNNGLRIGVANTTAPNGSAAYLFNQSNNHMIFSTGNSTANLAAERMRITHYGAPGTNQPVGSPAAANSTRVGISLTPGSLTNPWSLLHIGNNVNAGDGVRNRMNNGITIAQGKMIMIESLKYL